MVVLSADTNCFEAPVKDAVEAVLADLGYNHSHEVYLHAVMIELENKGFSVSYKAQVPILYNNHRVGHVIPDLVLHAFNLETQSIIKCVVNLVKTMSVTQNHINILKKQIGKGGIGLVIALTEEEKDIICETVRT